MNAPLSIPNARYAPESERVLLNGTQAVVRMLLEQAACDRAAGRVTGGYVSGYRGSPVSSLDVELQRHAERCRSANIHFNPGVNEDLAATAVWGSQQAGWADSATVSGVFGLWYGKGPGVDRCGDVFKHGNYSGTAADGGVIALAGDDAQAKSSVWPSQSDYAFIDAEMPVLSPGSVGELIELGLLGYGLSRYTGLWVGLLGHTDVMDSTASVALDDCRVPLSLPAGPAPREQLDLNRPANLALRHEAEVLLRELKLPAARAFARANALNRVVVAPRRTRIALVGVGHAFTALRDVLADLGFDETRLRVAGIRLCQVRMPWPLDAADVSDFVRDAERVLVVEHKRPLVEQQLLAHVHRLRADVRVFGKCDDDGRVLLSESGQLDALQLRRALARVLPPEIWPVDVRRDGAFEPAAAPLNEPGAPVRTPFFCSGCPHNSSTQTAPGQRVMAGVGCHVMAETMGRTTESLTQMGGEGVTWLGMSPFNPGDHVSANLGDGTFYHSGSMAIRAAVAAGVPITFKLLYNEAVAMTGGQTVDGPLTVARTVALLRAEGVERIALVSDEPEAWQGREQSAGLPVSPRAELARVEAELKAEGGVSVILYIQTCATEKRRQRKRGTREAAPQTLWINPEVCEGCGDCTRASNCLSVESIDTDLGVKRQINHQTCNDDYRCADGFCPSFVAVEGATPVNRTAAALPAVDLPEPATRDPSAETNVLMLGVGGLGITTTAAILSAAAHLDGLANQSLGMAGLAQKGGPVSAQTRLGGVAGSGKLAPASADLVIAADMVSAITPANLGLCDATRTQFVGNEHVAPTASQALASLPASGFAALAKRVEPFVRALHAVDAYHLAVHYLGDAVFTNTVMLGVALQRGALPVTRASVEQAIRDNGAAVERNLQALTLGRIAVVAPNELVARQRPVVEDVTAAARIDRLAARLVDYGGQRVAARYRETLAPLIVVARDETVSVAAMQLYRLMANKDEYEVARLHSAPAARAAREAAVGAGGSLSLYLAPPGLSPVTDGVPQKRRFGAWVFPALRLLQHGRVLRDTPFDPFGYTRERRDARALLADYRDDIRTAVSACQAGRHAWATEMLRWPQTVKGYGHVRSQSAADARKRRALFHGDGVPHTVVPIVRQAGPRQATPAADLAPVSRSAS
ncbi:MAG: indolepyruvate ferredoxin oxidoreductase family protein [Pseudomonadota bacterium]